MTSTITKCPIQHETSLTNNQKEQINHTFPNWLLHVLSNFCSGPYWNALMVRSVQCRWYGFVLAPALAALTLLLIWNSLWIEQNVSPLTKPESVLRFLPSMDKLQNANKNSIWLDLFGSPCGWLCTCRKRWSGLVPPRPGREELREVNRDLTLCSQKTVPGKKTDLHRKAKKTSHYTW